MTVIMTSAFWLLFMIGYAKLRTTPSGTGRGPTEEASDPTTRTPRPQALARALVSIASADPEKRPSTTREAEPNQAEVPREPVTEAGHVSREEAAAQQKADAFTLDQQLQTEEVDPVWSPKLERQTTEAIARAGTSMHLDGVTCRETLCRAKVSHLDPKTRDEDVEKLLNMPVVAGQAMAVAPSNDDRSTVLYFSRRGTYLSVLQPATQPSLPPEMPPEVMPPSAP
ncbi:MAG TPA: hypothetical protein VIU64_23910 [Polyangia bacterium]